MAREGRAIALPFFVRDLYTLALAPTLQTVLNLAPDAMPFVSVVRFAKIISIFVVSKGLTPTDKHI